MKLLGTLAVYETESTDCVSGLHSKIMADGNVRDKAYKIVLCPNSDASNNYSNLEKREQVQILAHELGHFVGHILNLPATVQDRYRKARHMQFGLNPDAIPMLPSEQEAWQVAEEILPGALESEVHKVSIQSYRKHDKNYAPLIEQAKRLFGE